MAGKVDARGMLEAEPFAYQQSHDGKVFILWQGRQVTILRDEAARKFLRRIENADTRVAQLIMAKATGNFKHGNEKGR